MDYCPQEAYGLTGKSWHVNHDHKYEKNNVVCIKTQALVRVWPLWSSSTGNQAWIFTVRTDAEAETPILWPPDAKSWLIGEKPWCWEKSKAGGVGDDRGWDGWMASLTQWTWIWANPGGLWRTRKPGVLQSMGSQRIGHDWVTEQGTTTPI